MLEQIKESDAPCKKDNLFRCKLILQNKNDFRFHYFSPIEKLLKKDETKLFKREVTLTNV